MSCAVRPGGVHCSPGQTTADAPPQLKLRIGQWHVAVAFIGRTPVLAVDSSLQSQTPVDTVPLPRMFYTSYEA